MNSKFKSALGHFEGVFLRVELTLAACYLDLDAMLASISTFTRFTTHAKDGLPKLSYTPITKLLPIYQVRFFHCFFSSPKYIIFKEVG